MKKARFILAITILLLLYLATCSKSPHPPPQAPDLIFLVVGGSERWKTRFGDFSSTIYSQLNQDKAARDSFLYVLAKKPLSTQEIIQNSDLSEAKVEALINQCRTLNWIKKSQGKWSTTIPVITDDQMISIKESLQPLALKLGENIKINSEKFQAVYEKEKTPGDPAWKEISHLVIDKLLIDGTFHGSIEDLEEEKTGKKYYTSNQKILPAFFLEAGKHAANFGCNWYRFEHNGAAREVYFLHGTFMDRYHVPLNPYRGDPAFAALLSKISPSGDYSSLSQKEVDILKNLGWIENGRFVIPIIQANSIKPLMPLLKQVGQEMAEIVFANYSVFIDSFINSPYCQFLEGAGDYIQACYHILFALIIDTLIEEHLLPPPPWPVPDSFAVYVTLGSVWK